MRIGDQISSIEISLKELIRTWERYFGGDIKVPPVKERTMLQNRLRGLYERSNLVRSGDRYRLEQLQHRFMTYSQNWERMLREKEEGRGRSIAHLRAAARAGGGRPVVPPANASRPASVDSGAGNSLFDRYQAAKVEAGQESGLDRKAFEKQIADQRVALEDKLGQKVNFDVKVDDGKVKLVVRKTSAAKNEE